MKLLAQSLIPRSSALFSSVTRKHNSFRARNRTLGSVQMDAANISAAPYTAQAGVLHAARVFCPCVCCSASFFPRGVKKARCSPGRPSSPQHSAGSSLPYHPCSNVPHAKASMAQAFPSDKQLRLKACCCYLCPGDQMAVLIWTWPQSPNIQSVLCTNH